jgi:site-specific DNA-methyltransferase (adenine-specific)
MNVKSACLSNRPENERQIFLAFLAVSLNTENMTHENRDRDDRGGSMMRLVRRVTAVGKNWAVVVPFESCGEKMWTVLDAYTGAAAEAEARGHALRCAASEDDCSKNAKTYNPKPWDSKPPDQGYFDELMRVSKRQIVWGGNYYASKLPDSRGWIFWDKRKYVDNFADGELAWTSYDRNLKKVTLQHHGFLTADVDSAIHPTQKPVFLYRWVLENYAKPGDRILDTHMGSGSIAIACHYAGHPLTACEIDPEYFADALDRIQRETRQLDLFSSPNDKLTDSRP